MITTLSWLKFCSSSAVELKEKTGAQIVEFINLSGGVGIPYRPDQEPVDIAAVGEGVRRAFEEVLTPAGMEDVSNLHRIRTLYAGA